MGGLIKSYNFHIYVNLSKLKVTSITMILFLLVIQDLPFYYPSNYAAYLNGTVLPPWPQYKVAYDSNNVIIGVRGVIPKDQYEDMLMAGHYGYFTEVDFHGYNAGMSDSFPFWSSEPLTYSSALLALTQYRHYLPKSALREGDN